MKTVFPSCRQDLRGARWRWPSWSYLLLGIVLARKVREVLDAHRNRRP